MSARLSSGPPACRQPPGRHDGGHGQENGGGDKGVAPVQGRMNPAAQQAPAQAAGHGGGDVRAHDHVEPLQGQVGREIGRQAGGEGRHEQPLDKAGRHQEDQVIGGGAAEPRRGHHRAPHQDEAPHREAVRQHPKGRLASEIPRITADTV